MNVFVAWRTRDGGVELVTPPLDGTILPGVTRDSILALARLVRRRGGREAEASPPALVPPRPAARALLLLLRTVARRARL